MANDLETEICAAFEAGADEIVLRISRYDADGTPAAFQALIKHRDRTRLWGVGVLRVPIAALRRGIAEFRKESAPTPAPQEDAFG